MTIYIVIGIIGGFGWGMYVQEIIAKRKGIKAKSGRIIIDAPFSPDQSETIMRVLKELNEAVIKSTDNQSLDLTPEKTPAQVS